MISVIIPTYNRKNMLEEVIGSIKAQTYKDVEIIIVDDCSSDGTAVLVENLKKSDLELCIRYFRNEENKGPGFNRNFGYKQASGDYIIFMDDDDYYTNFNFFENAIKMFDSQEDGLALVSADSYKLYTSENKKVAANIGVYGRVEGVEFLLNMGGKYKKPQSTFTTVFKKESLDQADLETMEMVNDYAIYQRALLKGDIYVLEDKIGNYRLHESNISNNIEKQFLLDNLEERIWVMENLYRIADENRIKAWWTKQMLILLKYYLLVTKPCFKDGFDVYKYMLKKSKKTPLLVIGTTMLILGYKVIIRLKNLGKKIKG